LDCVPTGAAPRAMRGDAVGHFVVAGLRGCHVDPRRRLRRDQALCVSALARSRAAEDEREPHVADCGGRHLRHQAPGTTCKTSVVRPTPTIAAPTSRGASPETPAPMWRAASAMPTASTLWL